MERGEFDGLCAQEGGISDTEAFADFLHHSGVVFYRRGLFGGRIVLDQNWALQAIYAIFDRKKSLPLLRNNGRFRRSDLEFIAWEKFDPAEQEVFLGMMQGCGICFPVRNARAAEEAEYLAPELLPRWDEAKENLLAGRLLSSDADAEAQADFGFLHEGGLRGYLSAIGTRAGDAAVYWKYGCWFYEKTTDSRALIESRWENAETEAGPGTIVLRAWGARAQALLEPLVEALDRVSMGQRPAVRWTRAGAGPLMRDPGGPDEAGGLGRLEIVEELLPAAGKPAIYVSYAWGDEESAAGRKRGEVVDGACRVCGEEGWRVVRDKEHMGYGDWISAFMKSITQADLILVVISRKYLRSIYCMTELHGIFERSGRDKKEFLERVIPFTLDDVKIGSVKDRLPHAKHWKAEVEAIQGEMDSFGAEDFQQYRAMKRWLNDVGDMLAFVSDVLRPQGFEGIVAEDYKVLREMLGRKRLVGRESAQ
jgi:internalin A